MNKKLKIIETITSDLERSKIAKSAGKDRKTKLLVQVMFPQKFYEFLNPYRIRTFLNAEVLIRANQ